MPPPLKGRALVDELCFRLPTYLQEQLGVTQIQVDARAGCTAGAASLCLSKARRAFRPKPPLPRGRR